MKQEDKELLLKDLCARLPYGALLCVNDCLIFQLISVNALTYQVNVIDYRVDIVDYGNSTYNIEQIKPYLRPMSSMTEGEKKELTTLFGECQSVESGFGSSPWYNYPERSIFCVEFGFRHIPNLIDWLNSHHFDYRGLIEKGLALEAPEGMYKI